MTMNFMNRTQRQAAMYGDKLTTNHGVRHWMQHPADMLDVTMLPVETTFKMCGLERRGDDLVIVEDYRVMGLSSAHTTLFEWDNPRKKMPTLFKPSVGVMLRTVNDDKGAAKVEVKPLFLDGMPTHMNNDTLTWAWDQMNKNAVLDEVKRDLLSYFETNGNNFVNKFIGQHTMRFPHKIMQREMTCFLGLPRGTKVTTKNGGIFTVQQRFNMAWDSVTGVPSGHLHMLADNMQAREAAEYAGWTPPAGGGGWLAGANLYIDSDKYRVKVEDITLPVANPLHPWSVLPQARRTMDVLLGVLPPHVGVVPLDRNIGRLLNNDEDFRNVMEKFLYG